MKLEQVLFEYDIKKKLFSSVYYTFPLALDSQSKEEVIDSIRNAVVELEGILDSEILVKGVSKEEEGRMTSVSLEFGYRYFYTSSWHDPIETLRVKLKYRISLQESKVEDANLDVTHHDDDEGRILRVYDKILAIPRLEISEKAQDPIRKINALRKGVQSTNLYLEHL